MNPIKILIMIIIGSNIGLIFILLRLRYIFKRAPILKLDSAEIESSPEESLTIIVPAYNEEKNIKNCIDSILGSKEPCKQYKLIIVDDESLDKTYKIAVQSLRNNRNPNIKCEIIKSGLRPNSQKWLGKNWACYKATINIKTNWILFIDADITLNRNTLKAALYKAKKEKIDLLSLAPRIKPSCLSEWIVQPIMGILLAIGFPIAQVNNKSSSKAFAAGPFMLFNAKTYKQIGGHQAVSNEIVEDIALARKIKLNGYNLNFSLGLDALEIRMYRNFNSLWEGWSKNWFIGLDRNLSKSFGSSIIVLWIFTLPWLLTAIYLNLALESYKGIYLFGLGLSITSILLQYFLRRWMNKYFKLDSDYWWLMGFGGLIVSAISQASTIKTITRKNWTWKGRPLG